MTTEQALARLGLLAVLVKDFAEFSAKRGDVPKGLTAEFAYNCLVQGIHKVAKDLGFNGNQIANAMADPEADQKWCLAVMEDTERKAKDALLGMLLEQAPLRGKEN